MQKQKWLWLLLLLMILFCLSGVLWLRHESDSEFRDYLEIAQPGTKLSTIKPRLGRQMYAMTNPDYMVMRGTVKDRAYCENKTLYWFDVGGASNLGDWVLEIYADENDRIVGVDRITE